MERELSYCINKVGCKGLIMRPNVKSIDCIKILNKILPEINDNKCELNSKFMPTLKHVILVDENNTRSNESIRRIPKGVHLYNELIRKGAGSQQDPMKELQSQLDGDTPLAIFYTSGTTGQPKASTLTNFTL